MAEGKHSKSRPLKPEISITDFIKSDLRVGTVRSAHPLPNARKPAIVMEIDFGPLGVRKTSAQITERYSPESLLHTQVIAVVNIPPVQIGSIMSECLVIGAVERAGDVILLRPDQTAENGSSIA